MKRKYQIGEKITPINKTPRIREHDNCGTFYQRQEMNQDFLYVVAFDEEEEKRLGVPCYWCNVVPNIGGDSFAESDLIPYVEKKLCDSSLEENVKELLRKSFLSSYIEEGIVYFTYDGLGVLYFEDTVRRNLRGEHQPSKEDVVSFIREFARLHGKEFNQKNPFLNIKTDTYLITATDMPFSPEPQFHLNVNNLFLVNKID